MIHITDAPPATYTGDIMLLAENTGDLIGGAAGFVAVDSFNIPPLLYGSFYEKAVKVVVYIDIRRYYGAENCGWNLQTTSGGSGTTPCSGTGTSYGYMRTEAYPSVWNDLLGTGNVTYFNHGVATIGSGYDNTTWGDILAAQTIYVNLQRRASSGFLWKYQVYLIAQDIN